MNNLLNFKSFFKFLSKHKAFAAINIFGLSVSLMFVIVIIAYVNQGLSTDKFHKNGDRIFAISSEQSIGFAWRIGERIAERYPEIEKMCPVVSFPGSTLFIGETKYKANILLTDTTFFDMFSFPLKQGDSKTVLAAKNYAVISEKFAREAFSDRDPMGQSIWVNDSIQVTVNGIIKDIKNSTIPYSDLIIKMDHVRFFNGNLDTPGGNNAIGIQVFFQTVPGADLQTKASDMEAFLKEIFWFYERGIRQKVTFTPLKAIYFSDLPSDNTCQQGSFKFVITFMGIGFLILIFAVINYINLTVAQTGSRAKEMATRRLLGSSRSELFTRLMLESFAITIFSFLIGLLFAFAILPYADKLLQTTIDLKGFFTIQNSVLILLALTLISFISGLLPAILISNTKPIDIVKGSFRTKTKMVFSKLFITFQNIITIMLLAASITMILQIDYMIKAPLGYNTNSLMDVTTYQLGSREKVDLFVNEVRQLGSVKRVGYAQGLPFNRGNNFSVVYKGINLPIQHLIGDSTYFNMLGFEIIHRNNSNVSGRQAFANEQLIREAGVSMDITEFVWDEDAGKMEVAGVVRDFQLKNISHNKEPVVVIIEKPSEIFPWSVLIETQGDPFAARNEIKDVYERVSQVEFTGKFINEQVEESYAEQTRLAQIVIIFSMVAIIISLLGLLAMSTYFIQQRSREISVRKVFGSTNQQILTKLIHTFLSYVYVAFLIAAPVIWFILDKWLSEYSYHIPLHPWIFVIAGLVCLFIAFSTVFFQSWKAANANPVDSIKTE